MKAGSALYPLAGVVLAITITATMDANGLTEFSALPLIVLTALFWAIQRLPRVDIGLTIGNWRDYAVALVYPFVILGLGTLVAILAGAVHPRAFGFVTLTHLLIAAAAGTLAALITEEGFFRGWLWASLTSAGAKRDRVLLLTSAIFALWHLSYVTMATGYILPPGQVAVFIVNAAVIGLIWGMMRALSGSIVVSSVSHSVWNAIAYMLFGEGPKIGLLGITQTAVYGAEVGVVGLVLNCAFALALFSAYRTRLTAVASKLVR
jgi:hypothetical protein